MQPLLNVIVGLQLQIPFPSAILYYGQLSAHVIGADAVYTKPSAH